MERYCRWCNKKLKFRRKNNKKFCEVVCKNAWHRKIKKNGLKTVTISIEELNRIKVEEKYY